MAAAAAEIPLNIVAPSTVVKQDPKVSLMTNRKIIKGHVSGLAQHHAESPSLLSILNSARKEKHLTFTEALDNGRI